MEKERKFYFAGSIRGGREDVELYRKLIDYIQTFGKVLTEHIALDSLKPSGIISIRMKSPRARQSRKQKDWINIITWKCLSFCLKHLPVE